MNDADDTRRHDRVDSQNLLEYVLVDEMGNPTEGGMGKTLNISEGGMLMEMATKLPVGQKLWVLIGVEEEMVEVEGHVRHVRESENSDRFVAGINFTELDWRSRSVLEEYLDRFNRGKQ